MGRLSLLLMVLLTVAACRRAGPAGSEVMLPTAVPPTGDSAAATRPALRPTPTLAPAAPTIPPPTVPPQLISLGDPYIPELGNGGYDVQQYTLQLALDPAVRRVNGRTQIAAVAGMDLSLLALDFVGFQITELLVNDAPAAFSRQGDKLLITPPQVLPAGAPFSIGVAYTGAPAVRSSPYVGFIAALGLQYAADDILYVLGEPDGARFWFPANDHPRDKAQFRFELTVPAGLTGVANGELQPAGTAVPLPLPGGGEGTVFVWEHAYPMATYLATVAVGPFIRLEGASPAGVPLRHYVLPGAAEEFAQVEAVTGEAIDWLSARLGPYPFEVIGFVTVPIPGASLETQTMILMSTGMIGLRTAVHELAHMWFGNWVSLESWGSMWLKEGMATYMQLLWEHRDDPEALALEMAALAAAVEENGDRFLLSNPPPEKLFGFHVYIQGALLAHALRLEVGDDAFFAGLQLYFQRHGGDTAGDADFQAAMAEAAGRPLDAFFAAWLE